MRPLLKFVWDRILIIAAFVAVMSAVALSGCASRPVMTEIVVGPVRCTCLGIMISCKGPEESLWTLDGKYATFGPEFSYYSPHRWTRLEITVLGWGAELWVRRGNGEVEYSLTEPK